MGRAAYPLEIEHRYYVKVEDLLEAINAIRPSTFRRRLTVSRQNKRVKLYLHGREAIRFHEEMARMPGFSDSLMQIAEVGGRAGFYSGSDARLFFGTYMFIQISLQRH